MGFKPNPKPDHNPENPTPTAEELVTSLRSSFFSSEFQYVANTLMDREKKIAEEYVKLKKKSEEERSVLVMEILKVKEDLKKKEEAFEVMRKEKDEYERKLGVSENRCLELEDNVLRLEKIVKQLKAENCKPSLFIKKEDANKKTESNLPVIIEIDDDDDDGNDQRKSAANEIKTECNTDDDDDDLRLISTTKKRHVPETKNTEMDSSSSDTCSDSDKAINKSYMSSIPKTKKQKVRWEKESDMKKDLEKDDELCLNGVCALHRQRTILHGADKLSLSNLACKLIDGDPQKKLNKKVSELRQFELDECRMFARKYALQLFNIYKEKSDPFFPTSRSQEKRLDDEKSKPAMSVKFGL